MSNVIKDGDSVAIEWLNEHSKSNSSLASAWLILKKYYDDCCDKLKEMSNLSFYNSGDGSRDKVYKLVRGKFNGKNKDQSFINDCCAFLGYSEDELLSIINSSEESQNINDIIIKIVRYYNMRLKLGHSARITYIAEYELNKLLENKDSSNYELLSNTVILSALLHDIGRFYQGIKYNSLKDNLMRNNEKVDIYEKLDVDHAVAGYFFSIAAAFELHKISNDSSLNEIKKFIEETVAALVVRYHQLPNFKLEEFEYNGNILNLSDLNNDFIAQMFDFIQDSYNNAKVMGYSVDFFQKHKEFIENFIKKLFSNNTINSDITSGFDQIESVDLENNKMIDRINNIIYSAKSNTLDNIYKEIISVINERSLKDTHHNFSEYNEEYLKDIIIGYLNGMLSFDVATAIRESLKNNKDIDKLIKIFISKSLSITTDADKIDIFNQRALGIYNVSYKMESYEIFPDFGKSLRELLNTYYNFNISNNNIVLDKNIINVLNRLNPEVINALKNTLFNNIDIFNSYSNGSDINNRFRDDIIILINDKNSIEVRYDNGDIVYYESSCFYDLFNHNYLDLLCNECMLGETKLAFRDFKKKNLYKFLISVPTEVIDQNIIHYTEEEKVNFYKRIVLSDGITNRYKYESDNKIGNGWIMNTDDSNHIVSSSLTAFLWQINQFIFVNMRNLYSFEFIKDNNLLDGALESFKKNDANIEYEILKEYIDYAKRFIDSVIDYCHKNHVDCVSKYDLDIIRNNINREDELSKMTVKNSDVFVNDYQKIA